MCRRMIAISRATLFIVLTLAFAAPARAHPHVWVTMTAEVVYAPDGSDHRRAPCLDVRRHVLGLRDARDRDQGEGQVHARGIGAARQGQYRSLKEYDYFTYATADGKKAELTDPLPDYWLDYKDQVLTLQFHAAVQEAGQGKVAQGRNLRSDYFRRFLIRQESAGASRRRARRLQARHGAAARNDFRRRQGAERIPADQPNTHGLGREIRQQDSGALSLEYERFAGAACESGSS